jgi:hypothetical protein
MRLILHVFRTSYRFDYPDLAELDPWLYKSVFLAIHAVCGFHPASYRRGSLSCVRRPKREAGRSPSPSVEHTNVQSYAH